VNERSENLRQRAVVLGLIQDDGPLTPEEWEREYAKALRAGLTEDQLCDTLEELLDCDEA
jgi:hypothetical protein